MKSEVFSYDGNPVTFRVGETTMVNATEMAKPFGKRPAKWLELPSAKDFLNQLSAIRKSDRLVETVNGLGTWMHEDVALEFARWLSPRFAIWCNDRIKELFRHGITATPQTIESVLSNPENAIRILQELQSERKEVDSLKLMNKLYQSENRRLRNRQKQYDRIISGLRMYMDDDSESNKTYTATQIAKEFGMKACSLNKFLHDYGVIFKQGRQWLLHERYANKGYMESREYTYTKKDGTDGIVPYSVWTEEGRMFVKDLVKTVLLERKLILPETITNNNSLK